MQQSKLGKCEVCSTEEAKYCCPECEVKTCSVNCVRIHKKELECNGIRSRVKFKPVKSFSNMDFLNDYRLLEEVGRSVEKYSNDKRVHKTTMYELPVTLYRLRGAAVNRNINLEFLPKEFSRHKRNTSFLNFKTQELFWRIEWNFPQATDTLSKYADERVLDSEMLGIVLDKHINPANNTDKSLRYYHSEGHSGLVILLKAEKLPGQRFFEMDPLVTLRENLCGKYVIEFPDMHVVLKNHRQCYDIISPDEEDKIIESWKEEQQQRKQQQRANNGKRNNDFKKGFFDPIESDSTATHSGDKLANKFNKKMKIDNNVVEEKIADDYSNSNDSDNYTKSSVNKDTNSEIYKNDTSFNLPNYNDL